MSVTRQIEERIQEFMDQKQELARLLGEASKGISIARRRNDPELIREFQDMREEVYETHQSWMDTKQKVNWVIAAVNKIPGVEWEPLGIAPILVGTVAVAAAAALTAMTLVITRTVRMRMQLEGIKDGWLNPQEAMELEKAGGMAIGGIGFGAAGGLLAAGVAAMFLLR